MICLVCEEEKEKLYTGGTCHDCQDCPDCGKTGWTVSNVHISIPWKRCLKCLGLWEYKDSRWEKTGGV